MAACNSATYWKMQNITWSNTELRLRNTVGRQHAVLLSNVNSHPIILHMLKKNVCWGILHSHHNWGTPRAIQDYCNQTLVPQADFLLKQQNLERNVYLKRANRHQKTIQERELKFLWWSNKIKCKFVSINLGSMPKMSLYVHYKNMYFG